MYFCNDIVLLHEELSPLMGMHQLFATWNSVWLWLTSRISVGASPFTTAQTRLN